MDNPNNLISARQRSWFFLQRLEAAGALKERQKVINMIVEEICDLNQQIVDLELELPEWKCPVLTASNMDVASAIGHRLADHMQFLCNYISKETDGEVWPVRRYDKRKIWPEEIGPAQQQTILPGMEKASGFESFSEEFDHGLPVFGVIQGGKEA